MKKKLFSHEGTLEKELVIEGRNKLEQELVIEETAVSPDEREESELQSAMGPTNQLL